MKAFNDLKWKLMLVNKSELIDGLINRKYIKYEGVSKL